MNYDTNELKGWILIFQVYKVLYSETSITIRREITLENERWTFSMGTSTV